MNSSFLEEFETSSLLTANLRPSLWLRYVDDTFVVRPHGREALQNAYCFPGRTWAISMKFPFLKTCCLNQNKFKIFFFKNCPRSSGENNTPSELPTVPQQATSKHQGLQSLLHTHKDKPDPSNRACECGKVYIGETGQNLPHEAEGTPNTWTQRRFREVTSCEALPHQGPSNRLAGSSTHHTHQHMASQTHQSGHRDLQA